jgi:hypothetical protein
MNATDRIKLIKAGYVIYRSDDTPQPRVKVVDPATHNWKTLEKFETKAARDRRMAGLAELPMWICD